MPFGDAPVVDEGHTTTAPSPPSTPTPSCHSPCVPPLMLRGTPTGRTAARLPRRTYSSPRRPALASAWPPNGATACQAWSLCGHRHPRLPPPTRARLLTPHCHATPPLHVAPRTSAVIRRRYRRGGGCSRARRAIPTTTGARTSNLPARAARRSHGRRGNQRTDRRLAVGGHADRCCGRWKGRGRGGRGARRSGVWELPTDRRPLLQRERLRGEDEEAVVPAADVARRDNQDGPHYLRRAPRQMI